MARKSSSSKRTLPAFGLALIAVLAFSGFAAASASASAVQWYSCQGKESGAYTDSSCQTEGAGKYEWTKLGSAPTAVSVSGKTFTLKATIALVVTTYTCSALEGTGLLANPASESGTLSTGTLSTESGALVLSGCTGKTKSGSECEVVGGKIPFKALAGTATEYEGDRAVEIAPGKEHELAEFQSKCVGGPQ